MQPRNISREVAPLVADAGGSSVIGTQKSLDVPKLLAIGEVSHKKILSTYQSELAYC